MIEKTAIIENGAQIGRGVSIGYNTVIFSGANIKDNVTIGSNCLIGTKPESKYTDEQKGLIIDTNTVITDFVTINLGTERDTQIGQDCYIMNNAYIAHDVILESSVTVTSSANILGNAYICEEAYIGVNSSIHQNSKIGKISLLGANSFAKGELRAGLIYVGSPAIPIKINKVGIENSKLNQSKIKSILKESTKFLE